MCPKCRKKTTVNNQGEDGLVLPCFECHYISNKSLTDYWFGQEFWLQAAFKNKVFWVNNYEHLDYMKQYISSGLRERNNRFFYFGRKIILIARKCKSA